MHYIIVLLALNIALLAVVRRFISGGIFKNISYFIILSSLVLEGVMCYYFYDNGSSEIHASSRISSFLIGHGSTSIVGKIIGLLLSVIVYIGSVIRSAILRKSVFTTKANPRWYKGAMMFSFIVMLTMFYGIYFGKYNYQVVEQEVYSKHLPASFDGIRVAQISDLHLGSFTNFEKFKKGLDLLQAQNPDVIVITGDLVNNFADEADPYVLSLRKLYAPMGKFAVMGNHDYGDYVKWETTEARDSNVLSVRRRYKTAGFKLLENSSELLHHGGGDTIALVGVENWGLPPFPQYGDLDKATEGVPDNLFKLLLSHDPDFWGQKVVDNSKRVDLTLSGHTHGAQYGFDLFGVEWSPVIYRYKNWKGLYSEDDKQLYVNIGFGYLGFPGRFGMWPEITIIKLKTEK